MEPGSNPVYILVGLHAPKATLEQLRVHLASFRYFNAVTKEFKDWGALKKSPPTQQLKAFTGALRNLTLNGQIAATLNWVEKQKYKANDGPYLDPGQTQDFRAFQLRLLLQRHKRRGLWGDNLDIVIDRWNMSETRELNLRHYVKWKIWHLDPRPAHVTIADSDYVGGLQVADMYARLAREVIEGAASEWLAEVVGDLMSLEEIEGGLFFSPKTQEAPAPPTGPGAS